MPRIKTRARKKAFNFKKFIFRFYSSLPYILVFFIFLALASKLWGFLTKSDYFDVKYVDVFVDGKLAPPNLRQYYGFRVTSNIINVDLRAMERELKDKHPEARSITLTRYLPERLRYDVTSRRAVAQLFASGGAQGESANSYGGKSDRYYPVDEDGMVLADVRDEPNERLPIIVGAEGAQGKPSTGRRCQSGNLKMAFELLRQIQRCELTKVHKLRYIDCTDPKNLSFYIGDLEVEIRMGEREFRERLLILSSILGKIGNDLSEMKYIDLRFKDPVVGPRFRK